MNVLARRRAEEELQHAHDQLEGRVEERTVELSKANAHLRQEIAQRRRVEETLRQSEERCRRLVEFSPHLIGIAVDQKIRFVNAAGAELLAAASPEQVVGKSILDFLHPDYRESAGRRIQQMMEEGIGAPLVEEKWLRLDGATIDVAVAAVPFPHQHTPAIQVVAYDITDRKRAESQRDVSLEALRESERKLRLIAENTMGVIYAYDMDRRLIYVNPALDALTGYRVEELQERNYINWLHPDDEARGRRLWEALFEGGTVLKEEMRIVTKNGQVKWTEGTWGPLYDKNGQQIGVQGHDRDITERKQAEQELVHSERLAALGQLAASLAHEINNPLQIIQNHLDLMLDFPIEAAQRQEYDQVIHHEIERLSSITTDMLDLVHPQIGRAQVADVVNVVQHVLALAGDRLGQAGIEVITDLHHVPPVPFSPEHLATIFLNLMVNAAEAMTDIDNGRLHIAVGAAEGHVVASFTNNGPAISDHVLPHIFEPFYATTKLNGSGLGLWASHRLLQGAGSLTVRNLEDGLGVTFEVRLHTGTSLTAQKG